MRAAKSRLSLAFAVAMNSMSGDRFYIGMIQAIDLNPSNRTVLARVFTWILPAWEATESDEGIAVSGAQKAFILKHGDEAVPVAEGARGLNS